MTESILTNTKKMLGLEADDDSFDLDVITHINGVFSTLNDFGVGPADGFMITDATETWDTYLGAEVNLNNVKQYMYLKVRLAFDPPSTSYLITALQELAKELEWRITLGRDKLTYVSPVPAVVYYEVFDGVILQEL